MKPGCGSPVDQKKRSVELPVINGRDSGALAIKASRTSRWRAAALITLTLLMIAHVIQWWLTGSTVSPIEPSETMYTLQRGAVNAGLVFFSLAIIATLIFGRFVCGWGCHIVALQDLCGWMLGKMGLKPRPFRSRLLVFVPLIVALYMFVWPTVIRFFVKPKNEPLFPQFTNHLITTDFWATFPPVLVAIPFLFICGFMTVYFLGNKGFCTYACPYGGFFAVADRVSPGKIRVTDACNQCGHCTAVCTSNVVVHAEVAKYGMVVDPGCMKCMDCVSVCPNDALYFGFGKPSIAVARTPQKRFSLTWPEEIFAAVVFFLSFMAVWDVYQLVPMLMALGIATVTTFLAVKILKLLRSPDSAFYSWGLKSAGSIRFAGWIFIAFSAIWIGLNAHSGYVRYHERAGAIAFESLQVPDELALAGSDPTQWLGPGDRKNVEDGRRHFDAARNASLFTNKEALSKIAWLEYLGGDTDKAVGLLAHAAEVQSTQGRALSHYYRGAIENRRRRYIEALKSLDAALAESPELVLAREERGESLWQLGRKDEAVAAWNDALRYNPGLVLANYELAGAAALAGDMDAAAMYERRADQTVPNDAFFHWMLGQRLENVGMNDLANKRFARAVQIDPRFRSQRK